MASLSVLVVDDEPDILKVVEIALIRWGYSVDAFTDPDRALKQFKNCPSKYSLIITDVRMPNMSGVEFARRAQKIRPDIKVLVMTAFEVDSELKVALPSIERGFLQKPFRTAEVCAAVKRCLLAA